MHAAADRPGPERAAAERMPADRPRVTLVDDDPDLRALIGDFLAQHGLDVRTAADAAELDRLLAEQPADLILLDVMMPGEDGLSVLRRLQTAPSPRPAVIVLSAMGDDGDRIAGLDYGADDYLAKPCNPRELLARIRAVLRRRDQAGVPVRQRRFGRWSVDVITRRVSAEGDAEVTLTDAEFRVLSALLDRPGVVLSRDQLLDAARGEAVDIFDRAIDVAVSRLRRKLGPDNPIRTIRSGGYMVELATGTG